MTREEQIQEASNKLWAGLEPRYDRLGIERIEYDEDTWDEAFWQAVIWADKHPKSPWIKCSERMPDTKSYKPTDTEYQVSEYVLTWDTFYGCEKNRLWNGEWETERKSKGTITPDVCHQIIAWMPIPKFEEE